MRRRRSAGLAVGGRRSGGGGGGTLDTMLLLGETGRSLPRPENGTTARPVVDPQLLAAVVDTTAVQVRPLAIDGAFEITPVQHGDDRGVFLEWFKARPFREPSATTSTSPRPTARCRRPACSAASTSPTSRPARPSTSRACAAPCSTSSSTSASVRRRSASGTASLLDDVDRRAHLPRRGARPRLHGARRRPTVVYLCSTPYAPGREHGVHPLDPAIGIDWPDTGTDGQPLTHALSAKDADAPSLEEVRRPGSCRRTVPAEATPDRTPTDRPGGCPWRR